MTFVTLLLFLHTVTTVLIFFSNSEIFPTSFRRMGSRMTTQQTVCSPPTLRLRGRCLSGRWGCESRGCGIHRLAWCHPAWTASAGSKPPHSQGSTAVSLHVGVHSRNWHPLHPFAMSVLEPPVTACIRHYAWHDMEQSRSPLRAIMHPACWHGADMVRNVVYCGARTSSDLTPCVTAALDGYIFKAYLFVSSHDIHFQPFIFIFILCR